MKQLLNGQYLLWGAVEQAPLSVEELECVGDVGVVAGDKRGEGGYDGE